MIDAVASEFKSIVFGFVQANNMGNTEMLKNLQVVFRAVSALLVAWRAIYGTHEGYESIWNDPVEVAVFHFFVVLVLLVIEVSELVPPVAYRNLQSFQTVENRTLVSAWVPITCISKCFK